MPEGGTPVETFLRAFALCSGAERAAVLRLDPDEESWTVETVVGADGATREGAGRRSRAAGHPLTWCLREELLVQLRAEELMPGFDDGGWALAGPVPDSSRVMVVCYGAGPPIGARDALGAALTHLGTLEEAGLRNRAVREGEPWRGSMGRQ